jgi:amidase
MVSDSELCYISATEALARFKARTLSPVELMQAVIARAEAVNPKINAFTYTFYDRALTQAKTAEAKYMKTDGRTRPLEGIPVVIKDETTIEGERTTFGSLVYKDNIDTYTAPPAERIFRAGAIMHARSTAPEFSCCAVTRSRLWGVTSTPWNLAYTSGGSSGGAAASLAAGTTTLANGSDIGGSIRIPASACGVVGFKPPYGRNPDAAPFNLDWYNHSGPMARTVADAALLQNVLVGPHPADIASLRQKLKIPARLGDIKGWKIAYSIDLGHIPVDPEVRRNTLAAIETFRELGCTVEEVDIGWDKSAKKAAWAHLSGLFGAWVGQLLPEHEDKLTDYALDFARRSQSVTLKDFLDGMTIEGEMYKSLGKILQKHNLLLCPTLAVPSVPTDIDFFAEFKVNGVAVEPYLDWCMTYPFNSMSRCPVMSVPSGFAANGVPTGLQIVGRTFDDVSVFRAAAAFEKARPWLDTPARRPKL